MSSGRPVCDSVTLQVKGMRTGDEDAFVGQPRCDTR